ncbi:rhomboid family intramembrane serine protease [Hyunsoonleella pacifica]|uniref:Rhomboid family intramembrane serine protease n=1 Tax=Hyunsoonleella pacifica TaxID=1080224 RepID=A0A4Q9FSD9_9FLAO|nr:rhomboid family intramembrane serine protease [Hyunsoonleella pacifica]TBN18590.1 rhomboid family intramembrane serine protease [Hyunsoonleella pacifica]GGD03057.1 rhomboid family intramembrane serine protease [Hyunsoonleella pacifica]
MTSLNQDIKEKLSRLNVLEKIIIVNIVVFLSSYVLSPLLSWLELPSEFRKFILRPWSIITYAFIHYEFLHLLFNMLLLYFVGRMFLNLFSSKMALNIYFLGAISGGIFYLLFFEFLPKSALGIPLVGASAAVMAILIFLCAYMPNQDVRIFTFNIKLWYIGAFVVALDVLRLFGDNGGGYLAHLGGALLGFVYAKQLTKGKDIGKGFEKFMDTFIGFFKFKKKSSLKTVHKNKSKVGGYTKADFNEFNNQKKVDVILDKISKSGYDSLTAEEKDYLFRAGK